jgi:hypothetical protein
MFHPNVRELARAGASRYGVPRAQRELVALSLRLAPPARTVKPVVERDLRPGTFPERA